MSELLDIDARVRDILKPARYYRTGLVSESLEQAAHRRLRDTDTAVRAAAAALLGHGEPWECMRRAIAAFEAERSQTER